jgi:hypothetical protein
MWTLRAAFQIVCGIVCSATLTLASAVAQQAQPAPQKPYGGGTPLDVIMHTKLWTDVPEMRDFVKAARPPEKSLDYIPTGVGTEPKRPPLRSSAQLQQMEDELENAGVRNEKAAGFRTRHFQVVSEAKKKPTPGAKTKTVSAR